MVQMTLSGVCWARGEMYMGHPMNNSANYYFLTTAFGKIPHIATREAVELTFTEAAERWEQGKLLEEWSITRQEWILVAGVVSGGRYRAPAIPGPPKQRVVVELDEENDALRPGGKVLVYPAVPANLPSSYSGTVVEL